MQYLRIIDFEKKINAISISIFQLKHCFCVFNVYLIIVYYNQDFLNVYNFFKLYLIRSKFKLLIVTQCSRELKKWRCNGDVIDRPTQM